MEHKLVKCLRMVGLRFSPVIHWETLFISCLEKAVSIGLGMKIGYGQHAGAMNIVTVILLKKIM